MNSRECSRDGRKVTRLALGVSIALAPWGVALATVPPRAPQTWTVLNCSDHDMDSLRYFVESPNTMSGDTIDLSDLPTKCGALDSRITLSTAAITIAQDALSLKGPAPGSGTVTISGNGAHRVFEHFGHGWLSITNVSIADGKVEDVNAAFGGCILSSAGSVNLDTSSVTGCTASSSLGTALGGAIATGYDTQLVKSTVSGNRVSGPAGYAIGGGIYARGALLAKYSSISDNEAATGLGGGAAVMGTMGVYHSAVIGNQAGTGGGLLTSGTSRIANSTISGNRSSYFCSGVGVSSGSVVSLEISNSTVAFNHSLSNTRWNGAAVGFSGSQATDSVALYSSIIADNTTMAANAPSDLYIASGSGTLSGKDNAVIASNILSPPVGVFTVTTDPMLGPLNAHRALPFHSPLPGSLLLGKGNNLRTFPPHDANTSDQRGPGYPRTTTMGGSTSVDIGAVQFDVIFVDRFD